MPPRCDECLRGVCGHTSPVDGGCPGATSTGTSGRTSPAAGGTRWGRRGCVTSGAPVAHSQRPPHVWFCCHRCHLSLTLKPLVWNTPAVTSRLSGTDRPGQSPSRLAGAAAVMESPFSFSGTLEKPRASGGEGCSAWKCLGWSPGNVEPQSVSPPIIYPYIHLSIIYPYIHLSII